MEREAGVPPVVVSGAPQPGPLPRPEAPPIARPLGREGRGGPGFRGATPPPAALPVEKRVRVTFLLQGGEPRAGRTQRAHRDRRAAPRPAPPPRDRSRPDLPGARTLSCQVNGLLPSGAPPRGPRGCTVAAPWAVGGRRARASRNCASVGRPVHALPAGQWPREKLRTCRAPRWWMVDGGRLRQGCQGPQVTHCPSGRAVSLAALRRLGSKSQLTDGREKCSSLLIS